MAFEQRHETIWNDGKRPKDGLNTDKDTTYFSKHETAVFDVRLGMYLPTHPPPSHQSTLGRPPLAIVVCRLP